ncbi:hypothetical protein [Blastopirellula marina]|uniref:Carboxypeptidase regulatory-like domain-containing protein n=1 Tax=Blastopirellula marina TaxID=124 RepID=A0A2S8F3Z5_9BACT|nr:hypothetical protein [Blastopirellula marina]PQO26885.1 hypothetical protein C5Y98_29380 [Blastopirellula marina]PTL41092.1 hypothetical protein C5Y97_29395 [Blastopirellula marina]
MASRRAALLVCSLLLLGFAVGCSNGTYPVHGSIVYPDGTPAKELSGGAIELDSLEQEISARGSIDDEGKFIISTYEAEDGAVPGKHRVLIISRQGIGDETVGRVIDGKYQSFETSGLELEVTPGTNTPTFTVERAKSKR